MMNLIKCEWTVLKFVAHYNIILFSLKIFPNRISCGSWSWRKGNEMKEETDLFFPLKCLHLSPLDPVTKETVSTSKTLVFWGRGYWRIHLCVFAVIFYKNVLKHIPGLYLLGKIRNLRTGTFNHECEFKLNWLQPKGCWSSMTGRGIFWNAAQRNSTVTRHFSSPTLSLVYHKFCDKTLINT